MLHYTYVLPYYNTIVEYLDVFLTVHHELINI